MGLKREYLIKSLKNIYCKTENCSKRKIENVNSGHKINIQEMGNAIVEGKYGNLNKCTKYFQKRDKNEENAGCQNESGDKIGKLWKENKTFLKHSAEITQKQMNWDDVFQYIYITLFISLDNL